MLVEDVTTIDPTTQPSGPDGAEPADATGARVMASHVPGVVDARST